MENNKIDSTLEVVSASGCWDCALAQDMTKTINEAAIANLLKDNDENRPTNIK